MVTLVAVLLEDGSRGHDACLRFFLNLGVKKGVQGWIQEISDILSETLQVYPHL